VAGAPQGDEGDRVRAGIYSRWIDTLGGGEQTLASIAATLAEHHDVDLITHEPPDLNGFQERLGFDLTGLGCRIIPYDRDHYRPLQAASRDYEVFVNCSYLDNVRAYARVNVLQVFFPPAPPPPAAVAPVPVPDSGVARLRAIAGLYLVERSPAGVFAWSDGLARFELGGTGEDLAVTLRVAGNRPPGLPRARVEVSVDGDRLGTATLPARGAVDLRWVVPGSAAGPRFLDVASDTFDPSTRLADARTTLGVQVLGASAVPARLTGRRERQVRPGAGIDRWTDELRYHDSVGTYGLLLANSHFTQRWIARRFDRASELLYPPVQVGQFHPGRKQRQIISAGRFFVEGHSKKQLDMIAAFRRLCDRGLTGWEYHLVGGTHHDPGSARYLDDCRLAAAGYPIVLHPNAPLPELAARYAAASLYWNATGYGEDPEREPDRFEHFGMTTVEAMASGCVPLSYARAGQPEVIEDGWSGVLWETFADLEEATTALIGDPARQERMSRAAVERSQVFTYRRFRDTLTRLLADAGVPVS
jgi:glycosyltransferase involved in cell wall biosynthesis